MAEEPGRPIRTLLVDDHPVVVEGLQSILSHFSDIEVIGGAGNGAQAIELVRAHRPDVVLLDLQLPPPSGADLIAALLAESPTTHVLVLTTYGDDEYLVQAVSAGASGYLLKGTPAERIVEAIRRVQGGELALSADLASNLVARLKAPEKGSVDDRPGMTPREREVLQFLITGATNGEIASALFISTRTVKAHLASIFSKLGVRDRTAAAIAALQAGIVRPLGVDPTGRVHDGPRTGGKTRAND